MSPSILYPYMMMQFTILFIGQVKGERNVTFPCHKIMLNLKYGALTYYNPCDPKFLSVLLISHRFFKNLKFGPIWPILKYAYPKSNQVVVFILQTM